jgi:tRNA pseudouridine38-40 synthase
MTTLRLVVAYDGTDFRGLAPNEGVRTVVGELERVLEPLIGPVSEIVMSGRTDAGVHAWGQVLSLVVEPGDGPPADLARIQRSVNARLGPEVVLRSIDVVDDGFNARFSATGRRYRYQIVNRPVPDPFLARTAWWVPSPLDVAAMEAGSAHLVGEHDFSSFCRRPKPRPGADGRPAAEASLVRRVSGARWREPGDGVLRFEIEGSAFCHQMVRSIVGLLVAVGSGKRRPDEIPAVLAARDRAAAEQPAPPHGLTLWQVDYEPRSGF